MERESARALVSKASSLQSMKAPRQGWIHTFRTALGMRGTDLAERMQTQRSAVANLERSEQEGRINLRSLEKAADAMGCRLVYAFVPKEAQSIEEMIEARAEMKAREIVKRAGVHMALEAQSIQESEQAQQIERLKKRILQGKPSELWSTKSNAE